MVKKITLRDRIDTVIKWFILLISCLITAFPFVWMIISALKTKEEIMNTSIFFPGNPQWGNIISILFESPIPKYIFNSLFLSIIIVAIQVITGALLAYALVYMNFKGQKLLFAIIMATYMLPVAATYIPSYIILAHSGLLNTFTGLIISSTVSIFGIFLLKTIIVEKISK